MIAAAGLPFTLQWSVPSANRERGAQLFHGVAPLRGLLPGQDEPLPLEAIRCQNCHDLESATARAPSSPASAAETVEAAAPRLGRNSLRRAASRRGGPASLYTEGTFCRLLRDGIDPTQIVIRRLMPRYELTDEECAALWDYLAVR